MEKENNKNKRGEIRDVLITAVSIGALWGIFESTAGYLIHLLPIRIGFLIWFPSACFFLLKSCKESGKTYAVLITSVTASSVKLLNLSLPGRIDNVINPAISILFEGIAVFAMIYFYNRFKVNAAASGKLSALFAVGTNTLWRVMFIFYLTYIATSQIAEVSVIRSAEALIRFVLIDNIAGSVMIWLYFQIIKKQRLKIKPLSVKTDKIFNSNYKPVVTVFLLITDIGLQFLTF